MGGSVNGIRAWLSELRRRGVFHVTGLYAVGAWAVVQIVDAISGPFPLPETALRLIWFAALLGFPVALVFGWRYDITKSGIVRTHRRLSHGEDMPIRQSDYGVIGGLALVMAGIAAMTTVGVLDAIEDARLRAALGPEFVEVQENSIAVLPFAVCDGDESDRALAEGLATEVINQLASQHLMRVIARTSAFTIASFDLPFLEMGQRLGVTHLLTGTLCRQWGELTVSVELLDEKGFVIWSETWRQDAESPGQALLTLAPLVVEGVAAALGHKVTVARSVRVQPRAYEHFVIGGKFLEAGNNERAKAEFEKAIEIQPDYTNAIYGVSLAVGRILRSQGQDQAALEARRPYIERALATARQDIESGAGGFEAELRLGEMLHSLGRNALFAAWRREKELGEAGVETLEAEAMAQIVEAEMHLRRAVVLNPSSMEAYWWLMANLGRQGRLAERREVVQRALEIEPFDIGFSRVAAGHLAAEGRYQEAIEVLERFERLPEVPIAAYWGQLEIMNLDSRFADQYEKLVVILRHNPELLADTFLQAYLWWMPAKLVYLGMHEEAAYWFDRLQDLPLPEDRVPDLFPEDWFREFTGWVAGEYLIATGRPVEGLVFYSNGATDSELIKNDPWKAQWHAWAFAMAGEYERAIGLSEALRHADLASFLKGPQAFGNLDLADLYFEVGQEEAAVRELEETAELMRESMESGVRLAWQYWQLARASAVVGRDSEALDLLEKHVDYGGWGAVRLVEPPPAGPTRLWSIWRRFDQEPRFLAIIDEARAMRDSQVQRIRALNERNDIDALLEPLFAKAREQAAERVASAGESG